MNKDVSIIFVNYKTKDLTINAIKSVYEKTEGINFEIFVVDNNSQDGSIEAIEEEFPQINIIRNPVNSGFGAANNLAIKQANGKYILCLNTDTLLVNNAIKIMFDFMEKEENQKVAVCGGYLVDKELNPVVSGGQFPNLFDLLLKFGLKSFFPKLFLKYGFALRSDQIIDIGKIDHIIGADIFFRKTALKSVGCFDEDFFMYLEETDLCFRIKQAGYDVKFVKDAKIIHLEGKSSKDKLEAKKRFRISQFKYLNKNMPNQVFLFKFLNQILLFIDGYILRNNENKKLFKFILKL